jgi:outer membrane immunogenic protein
MRKTALAAALLGALAATPAAAGSWTGCYGGVAGGYSAGLTDTSFTDGVDTVGIDSLGADGATLSLIGGCDLQFAPQWVVGVWGDYTWSDAEFSIYAPGYPDILNSGLDTSWAVGGRVGFLVQPNTLLYALAGYTQAELDDVTSGWAPGSLSLPTLDGYVVGGGLEVALRQGFYLQAQYTYANYDSKSVDLGGGYAMNLDTDVQTARVGLLYRFSVPEADKLIPAAPLK